MRRHRLASATVGGPLVPLISGLLLTGCAHRAVVPPPVTGWRELRSPHFRLRTDLPEGSARTTLEKLETLRWTLQAAWSTGGDSPGTTEAIVLSSSAELRTFTDLAGLATTTREGPLLVTAGYEGLLGDRSPEVPILAHEVGHELIRRRMPGAPRWYQEGLAGYLESVTQLDDRTVRFRLPQHPIVLLNNSLDDVWVTSPGTTERPILSLDVMVARRWETATEADVAQLYGWARLWVGVLRAEVPERMRELDAALARGTSWLQAWTDLRSKLDVDYLQEKLWRYLHAGGWPREVHSMSPRDPASLHAVSERALEPWEIHLSLARLWAVGARLKGGAMRANVRTELEAAVKAAPDEPLPQIKLATQERDGEARRAQAEALVVRFPASPDARVFLARVLRDGGGPPEERRAAALAAIQVAPDNVDALTTQAIEELRAGNAETALAAVSRAAEIEPWNSSVFVVRSLVLGAIGRCDEAATEAQRAIDVLPDDPAPADLRALVEEREKITGACEPVSRK